MGVGNEITNSELVSLATTPPSTYVLYAEDYSTIGSIRDAMEQKLCQGETRSRLALKETASLTGQ